MSRYRRALTGSTFFFTLAAYHRRPILCDDLILRALRDTIVAVRSRRPFSIDAWVQLPDHLHCIWTLPQDDMNFSQRWSEIKHHVSYTCRQIRWPSLVAIDETAPRHNDLATAFLGAPDSR